MNAAVGLMDGLSLDGDRCIRMIPRQYRDETHWWSQAKIWLLFWQSALLGVQAMSVTAAGIGGISSGGTTLLGVQAMSVSAAGIEGISAGGTTLLGVQTLSVSAAGIWGVSSGSTALLGIQARS